MCKIIHANEQDRQWKQYTLFSVYRVDEHENCRCLCGCAFYFQFGINLLI